MRTRTRLLCWILPVCVLAGAAQLGFAQAASADEDQAKAMLKKGIAVSGARVLVLGLAFKENCPDLRNTGVVDVVRELAEYGARVDVHDPWVDAEEAKAEYGIELVSEPEAGVYEGVVLAVAHGVFREQGVNALRKCGRETNVFFDLKSIFLQLSGDLRL